MLAHVDAALGVTERLAHKLHVHIAGLIRKSGPGMQDNGAVAVVLLEVVLRVEYTLRQRYKPSLAFVADDMGWTGLSCPMDDRVRYLGYASSRRSKSRCDRLAGWGLSQPSHWWRICLSDAATKVI